MRLVILGLVAGAACGSQTEPATTVRTSEQDGATDRERARQQRLEQERRERAEITARHRKLEHEQQDALAATCDDAAKWAKQHCSPSCYPPEPEDPRAGTKLTGKVELQHHVCQRTSPSGEPGPWMIVEELEAKPLVARAHRGRVPAPHKKGTWQADIATALAASRLGKAPRGEVFSVLGKGVRAVTHPVTKEALRCVTVAQYTTLARTTLDACGTFGKATCEAAGDAAARGLNLARYRLLEAAQLRDAGKDEACRTAAIDALATARGLPRWRQYAKLNVGAWTEGLAYKTRFDGVIDEDALFALAPGLVAEAEALLAACGMVGVPRTPPTHEHAFHSCP